MVVRGWLLVLLLVGCGQHAGSSPPTGPTGPTTVAGGGAATAPEPAPAPPALRLPRTFLPTGYTARLSISPDQTTFHGSIQIDGTLAEPTRLIWLHAQDLTFSVATATAAGKTTTLEALPAAKDFVAFRAPSELAAGPIQLSISYTGAIDGANSQGVFRNKDRDTWYAYTQFEALYARRAFPCFDEPDVKVPWQLTLEVPAGDVAVSNTPIVSEQPGTDASTKVVTFARTKPLPSYLIAFAVGPFELVDAGATRSGAPLRVVVPRGHATEASWVIEATGPLLARLEDYFGTPYPYEKLDLVAVPLLGGAMENAGMITFGHGLLLAKPAELGIGYRRSYATVAAHEMAHQWFGDLVTTAWWDDIWLNEAFATWMESKIVEDWKPEWGQDVDLVGEKAGAMGADSLKTARKIHNPITTADDILGVFDNGITYAKGAAVIHMFELWVGEAKFQAGIRAYLAAHADKNATSADFLAAIGDAGGVDVVTPFSTFLDQVGTPLVSFELSCAKGAAPTVKMSQQRYLPIGSTADAAQTWQVPVCVKYAAGTSDARDCTLLTAATGELPLTHATSCPAWLLPNAGELGYYRMEPKGDLLQRLLAHGVKKLTLPERVGLIGDIEALVASGQTPAGEALALVGTLAKDDDRHIVQSSAGIVAGANELVRDPLRPSYQRFIRKVFGARAKALGWKPKPGESDDTKILRSTVVGQVAYLGDDKALDAEATKLAWAWLDNHDAVSPDIAGLVLAVAVRHGDRKLFDRLIAEAKKATDTTERGRLLGALGGFTDPALANAALGLLLTDEFDLREVFDIVFTGLGDPRTRRLAYDFVKANADAIIARLPREYGGYLALVGTAQCDAGLRKEVEEFFTPRTATLPGGATILTQGLEQMDLCIAHTAAMRPSVEQFLKKY